MPRFGLVRLLRGQLLMFTNRQCWFWFMSRHSVGRSRRFGLVRRSWIVIVTVLALVAGVTSFVVWRVVAPAAGVRRTAMVPQAPQTGTRSNGSSGSRPS